MYIRMYIHINLFSWNRYPSDLQKVKGQKRGLEY